MQAVSKWLMPQLASNAKESSPESAFLAKVARLLVIACLLYRTWKGGMNHDISQHESGKPRE
jgi:hypothetical protein